MTVTATGDVVGTVAALWRYPVKSTSAGEHVTRVHVSARGLDGDRLWAVRDGDGDGRLGSGKTTRRFRRTEGLLALVSSYDGDVPVLRFPDGRRLRGDDPAVHAALSAYAGRDVRLAVEDDVPHADEGPVHLVTTSTLRHLDAAHGAPVDARHLRPNLLLDTPGSGLVEPGWVGRRLAVGVDLVVQVREPMPRCVMVTSAQDRLDADPDLLRTVTDVADGEAGVVLDVVTPGEVAVGDEVRLADG
ncbi:MOSC domain-containing protein [Aquipuribacter sp. SD81]|uniref:MOSC domain-containing protein n=1 Tax=Aquipuribacter sp. SD81 TaxID=3127703 RepID=UPI0030199CCC